MKQFVNALRQSVDTKNYYGALMMALTLPDICRKLIEPKSKGKVGYIAWFDQWISPKYTKKIGNPPTPHNFLSGADAYALRCAYLHQGEFQTLDQSAREAISHFSFIVPAPGMDKALHCNKINSRLFLQVDRFCTDVADAVEEWLATIVADEHIQKQIEGLARILFLEEGSSLLIASDLTVHIHPPPRIG